MKKIVKIDTSFHGLPDETLITLLDNGWFIIDKTVLRDRYIQYILSDKPEPFIGECSAPLQDNKE